MKGARAQASPLAVLAVMTALGAALFVWLSISRHLAYQSHAFDLGNMDQAAWNTLHGHLLRFTDMDVGGSVLTSRLAIHVEPLLVPLSLLYLVHSGPETLLTVQGVVVALGAVPAYLLARQLLGRPWLSLVFPAAYLLNPSLQNAVLDDFHAVTLSACLLLWALYWLFAGAQGRCLFFAALAALTKEEVALVAAAMGLLCLARGWRRTGLAMFLPGALWFVLCVAVIVPHWNPGGHSPYLARYAYLGHGPGGVVLGAMKHPGRVLSVLTSEARLRYLLFVLHPLGFVSLLGLPVLLIALPTVLINMLSADPTMYSGLYQYSAEIVPVALAAAAAGIAASGALARRHAIHGGRALAPLLCLLVLAGALWDSRREGFTPIAMGYLVPAAGAHQRLEDRVLRRVPPPAVVAAADEIEPHLSDRRWIYLLPTIHPRNGPAARYIVLDASIPSLPVTPRTLHALTLRALESGYGIEAARDGVLLLRRGAHTRSLPRAFFSFAFQPGRHVRQVGARWGPLELSGITVHPAGGILTRARPALEVETYWRLRHRITHHVRIWFAISPVYSGVHPRWPLHWTMSTDSPTLDWLPPWRWPIGRMVHVASLPLLPGVDGPGNLDLAVGVSGLGPARGVPDVSGSAQVVPLATVRVDP